MAKIKQLIECVPNFSEGRDMNVINQITDEIRNSAGVRLLDVDPGEATNRTVVTFVGEPDAVMEAAFRAVRKASQLIDMRQHHGAHPRSGATDVLPLPALRWKSAPNWLANWQSVWPTNWRSRATVMRPQL
mgnify:CR=1 FL=1